MSKLIWMSWALANDDGSVPHLFIELDGKLSERPLCGRQPGPDIEPCSDWELSKEEYHCNPCHKKFNKILKDLFVQRS